MLQVCAGQHHRHADCVILVWIGMLLVAEWFELLSAGFRVDLFLTLAVFCRWRHMMDTVGEYSLQAASQQATFQQAENVHFEADCHVTSALPCRWRYTIGTG